MSEDYDLKKSKDVIHELYPVLKDAHGNVIDGFHRLEADPNWKTETLEDITTPVQLATVRIVANMRRKISKEERRLQLVALAEELVKEGVTKENVISKIVEKTTLSEDYVRRMLPVEYKSRPGIGGGAHESVGLNPTQPHEHVYDEGSTQCRICGRPLTAPKSVKAGIGPICVTGQEKQTPEQPPVDATVTQHQEAPKILSLEEKAFALIDDLRAKFGDVTNGFQIDQLREKLRIYRPDSDKLIEAYKKRCKTAPQPPVAVEPPKDVPGKAQPETESTDPEIEQATTCPLCGQVVEHIDKDIILFIAELSKQIPHSTLVIVEEALRRTTQ